MEPSIAFWHLRLPPVSTQGEAQSQESQPKDQLGVRSAANVLADAVKVHTYTRRRRTVNTGSGGVSTASRIVSTAKESISTSSASMPVSTASMVDKVAQTFTEEEWENIKARVEADEELTQRLQEEEREKYKELDQGSFEKKKTSKASESAQEQPDGEEKESS
nr:hypothetical protein [Tanacetum cinerariifolium]